MTIIPWPGKRHRVKAPRQFTAIRLPEAVLDSFAADIPGPKSETPAEHAINHAAHRKEILSYRPRDAAEAMLATQCILLGLVTADAKRDAAAQNPRSASKRKVQLVAKQLSDQTMAMHRLLVDRQAQPLGTMNEAILAALGFAEPPAPYPIPGAAQPHPAKIEDAVIVPLHPAPKMLQ
jgi:hypothetical protein